MNDEMINIIINSLEDEQVNIVKTIEALSSQGYFINDRKYNRIDFNNILLHCFSNYLILDDFAQSSLCNTFNKLSRI